jgi:hypothetical protein
VWPKTREKVELEFEQLYRLVLGYRGLSSELADREPDSVELAALAAYLHSFYTGLENVFRRIAAEVDGQLPSSPAWHNDLLDQMSSSQPNRPALMNTQLRGRLADYLVFRHYFRHGYTFTLRWEKMRDLVADAEAVLLEVEKACRALFEGG